MSRMHTLKTWPEPFLAVIDGKKHHEIRHDDRGFAVGDVLNLKEWDPTPPGFCPAGDYTGRKCWVRVTYMTPSGAWGLPDNRCVMSIEMTEVNARPTLTKEHDDVEF